MHTYTNILFRIIYINFFSEKNRLDLIIKIIFKNKNNQDSNDLNKIIFF